MGGMTEAVGESRVQDLCCCGRLGRRRATAWLRRSSFKTTNQESIALGFRLQRRRSSGAPRPAASGLGGLLPAAICLLLAACTGPGPSFEPTPYRFIGGDTVEFESLVGRSNEFAWRFDAPGTPALFELSGAGAGFETVDGRAILSAAGGPVSLTRQVELAAETVDIIELTLAPVSDLHDQLVVGTLEWAGAGEEFAEARRLTARHPLRGANQRFAFRVRNRAAWQGSIELLRLTVASNVPMRLELLSVIGYRRTLSDGALTAMVSGGCKVEIAGGVRNSLPGLPGADIVRRLEIAPQSRLSFSFGAMRWAPLPVRFRVSVEVEGRDPVGVFEAEILNGRQRPWRQAEVDLSGFAGQRVEIRLTTESFHPVDPARGFPAWGNPEVHGAEERSAPPSIVLISLDTLRADRLSIYGYERPTSPNLDAWAERSATVFGNAIAQAPWTLPSHVSLLTGLNAHRHGIGHEDSVARPGLLLLPEILRAAGYASLAITGGGWLHPRFGFTQGFDRFLPSPGLKSKTMAAEIETALAWTREYRDRPYFLFFHTYEVHAPYRPRAPYFDHFSDAGSSELNRLLAAPRPPIVTPPPGGGFVTTKKLAWPTLSELDVEEVVGALYDSGIAAADELLARLLNSLEREGFLDNGIVVITSDHGELLGEHGLAGHEYLYDENLKVPLLIAGPAGLGAGQEVAAQVRSVDVMPTVLELAGVEAPAGLDGQSLVGLMKGGRPERASEAWSYAPRSNHGLSLRLDNRLKYVFKNSVWGPVRHGESLFRITDDGREEPIAGKPGQMVAARSKAVAILEQQAPGLRMRLRNTGSRPFRGRLEGEMVTPYKIKSTDMTCDCVSWVRSGEVELEVPPETSYTLSFEGVRADRMDLALSLDDADGGSAFEQSLSLSEIDGTLNVLAVGSSWQISRSGKAGEGTGVALWWHGGRGESPGRNTGEPDPQLENQLRALGYLR